MRGLIDLQHSDESPITTIPKLLRDGDAVTSVPSNEVTSLRTTRRCPVEWSIDCRSAAEQESQTSR
jgi:hypothetical protein